MARESPWLTERHCGAASKATPERCEPLRERVGQVNDYRAGNALWNATFVQKYTAVSGKFHLTSGFASRDCHGNKTRDNDSRIDIYGP